MKTRAELFNGEVKTLMGIDPGWKNLGYAVVNLDEKGQLSLLRSGTMNPSTLGLAGTVDYLVEDLTTPSPELVTIERFISYKGVHTSDSENIVMVIGGLDYAFQKTGSVVESYPQLVRAIEWKTELVKLLVKNKGFDNPSTSLDKKFSIAAAKSCLDIPGDFKSDHEADAVCLACLPVLRERYGSKKK